MSMGHNTKEEKIEYDCKKCGKVLTARNIVMAGKTWRSTKLKSYFECSCGADRVRVKGSGHRVIK